MDKIERTSIDDLLRAERYCLGFINGMKSKYNSLVRDIEMLIKTFAYDNSSDGKINQSIFTDNKFKEFEKEVLDLVKALEDEKYDEIYDLLLYLYISNYIIFCYELEMSYGFDLNNYDIKNINILDFVFEGETVDDRINRDFKYLNYTIPKIVERAFRNSQSIDIVIDDIKITVNNSFTSNVGTMFRTYTNYSINYSKKDAYKNANLEYYIYSAILDDVTTQICRSLDTKIFRVDEATPFVNYPPMHYNCRSTTYPYNSTESSVELSFEEYIDRFNLTDEQTNIVRRYYSV